MTIRTITPAALAAVALALGACGGSDDRTADAGGKGPEDAGLAFAKCMREQGIDFPDPVTDKNGLTRMGPGENLEPDDPRLRKANDACRKHLQPESPPDLSAEEKQEMVEAGLRFAECMREQGIDFPDPTSDGGIRLGPDSGIDLDSEGFQTAEEACRDKMPVLP